MKCLYVDSILVLILSVVEIFGIRDKSRAIFQSSRCIIPPYSSMGDEDEGTGGALKYQAPKDPSRQKAAPPVTSPSPLSGHTILAT